MQLKKIFWVFFLSLILASTVLMPLNTDAADTNGANYCNDGKSGCPTEGLVPCGNVPTCPCCLTDIFVLLAKIFNFVVKYIAWPLAIFMVILGAVFLLISAGNPGLASDGKKIILGSIIGMVLIFCSWLIIDLILNTLGYDMGTWWTL